MTIFINHAGFTPQGFKRVLKGGSSESDYIVRTFPEGTIVFQGRTQRVSSDFGQYTLGDFSRLVTPGRYTVQAGEEESLPFQISSGVYDDAIAKIQGYFTLQRCGDTQAGWNGPCHLDDGLRGDTLAHQDVTGGWHDACDLRKWVSATIYGMLGLAHLHPFTPSIEEELRWGNRYFLAMQEPDGYLMNFVGGDYYVHADNNRWTDNVADGKDDRLIEVAPCDPVAQWTFVEAESILSEHLRDSDSHYADLCLDSARRCAQWTYQAHPHPTTSELGAGISALLALHRACREEIYVEQALMYAELLLRRQVGRQVDSRSQVWGFFWDQMLPGHNHADLEPYKDLWRGCRPVTALCDLIESLPRHAQAPQWRESVTLFIDSYLAALAGRNAFHMVPYGLFRSDPGGGRDLGRFFFRYFYPENPSWYVGVNANLASTGVGLLRASRLLDRPDWAALAQSQLDWILGCNPFNASTIMAVGYNNPQHMFGYEYEPMTPFLPGAVMNGISGNSADQPQLRPGSWQDCEYWTPMVAYTLWLLSEIRKGPLGETR